MECLYTDKDVGECGCPVCDADDCEACIAHTIPMTNGKRYCYNHFMFGTANSGKPLMGILNFIKKADEPKPAMTEQSFADALEKNSMLMRNFRPYEIISRGEAKRREDCHGNRNNCWTEHPDSFITKTGDAE